MKIRLLFLASLAAILFGCDQKSAQRADDQRQEEEKRLTELRELEQGAAQREADANAAENALERKRLADAQAELDSDRQKLVAEKARIQEDAAKLAQWRADEQRLGERQAILKSQQDRSAQAERDTIADAE